MSKIMVLDVGANGGPKQIIPKWLFSRSIIPYLEVMDLYGVESRTKGSSKTNCIGLYKKIFEEAFYDRHGEATL